MYNLQSGHQNAWWYVLDMHFTWSKGCRGSIWPRLAGKNIIHIDLHDYTLGACLDILVLISIYMCWSGLGWNLNYFLPQSSPIHMDWDGYECIQTRPWWGQNTCSTHWSGTPNRTKQKMAHPPHDTLMRVLIWRLCTLFPSVHYKTLREHISLSSRPLLG